MSNSKEEKFAAFEEYKKIDERLKHIMGVNQSNSLLHQETMMFLDERLDESGPDFAASSLIVFRQLNSIVLTDANAPIYIDCLPNGEVNTASISFLESIHERVMRASTAGHLVLHFSINWHPSGIADVASAEHKGYLASLSSAVRSRCIFSIEQAAITGDAEEDAELILFREVSDHWKHAQDIGQNFVTLPELEQLFAIVSKNSHKESNKPILLLAPAGSGKSYTMAALACKLSSPPKGLSAAAGEESPLHTMKSENNHSSRFIITRFVNATAQASSLTGLLSSICRQLVYILDIVSPGNATELSGEESLEELTIIFPALLSSASDAAMIWILIDGLDECVCRYDLDRSINWVPSLLPSNVRMVLSLNGQIQPTLVQSCAETLKERLNGIVIGLAPLTTLCQKDAIESLLSQTTTPLDLSPVRRRLPKNILEQLSSISDASNPFYLSLFIRLWNWDSAAAQNDSRIPLSLQSLIAQVFEVLAVLHGEMLVDCVLGLLIAAERVSSGLSELELLDLLSTMDPVLDEMRDLAGSVNKAAKSASRPAQKRVRRMLWVALKYDMIALGIIGRCSDETEVLWCLRHSLFGIVARQRQVSDDIYLKSLLALKSLFTGELMESFQSRMINHCAHLDNLGKKRRLRKIRLLPRLWTVLTLETDGIYADALVSLLCSEKFRECKLGSNLKCELSHDYEEAIDAVSRCSAIKPGIKRRFLSRLAVAAVSLPEPHGGGGEVLNFEDTNGAVDSVAVGHRLREWVCSRLNGIHACPI